MKMILSIFLYVFTFTVFCGSSNNLEKTRVKKKQLDSLTLYSMPWATQTTTGLTAESLIYHVQLSGYTVKVTDNAFLNTLDSHLHALQNGVKPDSIQLDARTVGLLHWNDSQVDTMILSQFNYIAYQNRIYDLDSVLLKHVAGALPYEHTRHIIFLEQFWKE